MDKVNLYLKGLGLYKRILKKESFIKPAKIDKNSEDSNETSQRNSFKNNNNLHLPLFEKNLLHYKKELKRKFPFWLSKSEQKDIISEIEASIREVILEYEHKNDKIAETNQKVINIFPNIDEVVSEYKSKGTPKVFISKELWDRYMAISKALLIYFFTIGILQSIWNLRGRYHFSPSGFFVTLSFYVFFYFLLIFSLFKIFIFLSISDYIPSLKDKSIIKKQSFIIWELAFIVFYFFSSALILYFTFSSGDFYNRLESRIIIILYSVLIFILGIVKLSTLTVKKSYSLLKFGLLILILITSFTISSIFFSNFYTQDSLLMYYDDFLVDLRPINIDVYF